MSFGETLRELRTGAGLKQTELAARAGVSDRTVSKLEHGTPCSPATARKLATALGLAGIAQVRFVTAATGGDADNGIPLAVAATRTLPHDVGTFTGREEELRQLREFASAGVTSGTSRICVVHGMAGVGKTAFAVHFAHEVADHFPDGQLFVRLYGHEDEGRPVEPVDVLSALLLAVDILPGAIPDGVEERAALWRSELAKRRMLLLFDDASGSEQILPLLPGSGGTLVLVTSRQRVTALPEADDIPLETMTADDAAGLFVRIARRPSQQADSAAVAKAVSLCGFLPLAITLAAGHLRQHRAWAVTDLVAAITQDGGLGRITADRVAAVLDLSYRNLAPGLQRFFRCLGLHPGSDLDSYAAAALAGLDPGTAQTMLDELFDYHLIEEPAARGRYRFHDLIHEYARAAADAADSDDERLAAQRRLLAYYLHMARAADRHLARRTPSVARDIVAEPPAHARALATPAEALAWMDAEYLNLHAAADYAAVSGLPEYAIAVPAAMDSYLFRRGYWRQALDLCQLSRGAARDLGDDAADARILTDMGRLQYMMADMGTARASLTEAVTLHGTFADPLGEAHALLLLGGVDYTAGDYDAAVENWRAALVLYRRVGDPRGEADVAGHLGVVQAETGDYPAAIASQQAALAAYAALGDPIGQGHAHAYLGELHGLQGRYDAGIEAINQALELFYEADDQWNVAGCLYYLGAVQRAAGDMEGAAANLGRALEMYREAHDEWDEAGVRTSIGMVQTATGQYPEAAASLARAGEIYGSHGSENGEVEVLNSRGELALATDDPAAALIHHRAALETAVRLRIAREEARACEGIGRCLLATGERDLAIDPLRSALEIYLRLGSPQAERVRTLLDGGEADG